MCGISKSWLYWCLGWYFPDKPYYSGSGLFRIASSWSGLFRIASAQSRTHEVWK